MSFQEALGTEINFSTAYHPKTDGKTERMNQTLEDMFFMYVMDQQKHWEELFPLMEFAYNNSYQSTIREGKKYVRNCVVTTTVLVTGAIFFFVCYHSVNFLEVEKRGNLQR
jgi:hypothetical protein